jgi:hypothetical protein
VVKGRIKENQKKGANPFFSVIIGEGLELAAAGGVF